MRKFAPKAVKDYFRPLLTEHGEDGDIGEMPLSGMGERTVEHGAVTGRLRAAA